MPEAICCIDFCPPACQPYPNHTRMIPLTDPLNVTNWQVLGRPNHCNSTAGNEIGAARNICVCFILSSLKVVWRCIELTLKRCFILRLFLLRLEWQVMWFAFFPTPSGLSLSHKEHNVGGFKPYFLGLKAKLERSGTIASFSFCNYSLWSLLMEVQVIKICHRFEEYASL